jgi:hypothetical protein
VRGFDARYARWGVALPIFISQLLVLTAVVSTAAPPAAQQSAMSSSLIGVASNPATRSRFVPARKTRPSRLFAGPP